MPIDNTNQPTLGTEPHLPVYNAAFADISATVGAGKSTLPFGPILLAGLTNADITTDYTPGYPFKLVKLSAINIVAATTAAKAATVALEIGTTAVTGGVLSLTSANMTPKGVTVDATAITAANTGSATDNFSLVASSVTAFVEGSAIFMVEIENTATSATQTVILSQLSAINATLRDDRLITTDVQVVP